MADPHLGIVMLFLLLPRQSPAPCSTLLRLLVSAYVSTRLFLHCFLIVYSRSGGS